MNADFAYPIKSELGQGEQILWQGRPNVDVLRSSLVATTVLWMSGLFMFGVGMLKATPDDSHALMGIIVVLVLIAVAGFVEIIFVPRRAGRTVYVITNKRVFSLCAMKKLMTDSEHETSLPEKSQIKVNKNSELFFYLSNLPAQIFFFILVRDVFLSLTRLFDVYTLVGFLLILVGWLQSWIWDMRVPFARFRDCPRIFFEFGNYFVFMESVNLEEIKSFKCRKGIKNSFNCFVVTGSSGCLRLRAIDDLAPVKALLEKKA